MTTEVLAISFVYCPACYGGRKIRVRFRNNAVVEATNAPNYAGYDLKFVEGKSDEEDIELVITQQIVTAMLTSGWMRGNGLFQGVDFL
jgi:hypothetical protein